MVGGVGMDLFSALMMTIKTARALESDSRLTAQQRQQAAAVRGGCESLKGAAFGLREFTPKAAPGAPVSE